MASEEAVFFESKGFPYRISNMDQMFSTVASAGDKTAVIVQVNSINYPSRYYVGYYDPIQATNVAAKARRIRKFKVLGVGQFRGSPFAKSL